MSGIVKWMNYTLQNLYNQTFILLPIERMSNAINARVEELREHLKKYYDETIYLETRLDRAKRDNKKLEKENKRPKEENKILKELIREYFDEDKKVKNMFTEEGILQ